MPKISIEDALTQIRSTKSESGSNTLAIEDALSGIRSGKILPQEQKPIEEPPEEPSLLDRVKNFSRGVLDKIKTPAIEDALARIRATPVDLTAAAPGPLQLPFQIGKAAARAAGVLSPEAQRTLGEVDKDVAIRTGKNFGQAVAGMGSGLGGIMKWAGAENLGKHVSEYSDKMAQTYQVEDPNLIDEFQTGLASTLVFAVPGIGVSAGTNFVAAIPALARYSKWLGAGVSGLLESGVEAGNAYEDALKGSETRAPMTPQQASAAAAKTFMLNLPTIVYTNQKGLFGESGGAVLKWIKSASAEGVQEFLQKIYGNFALKDPIMQGAIRSGVIGALSGGVMGGVMDSGSPGRPSAQPIPPNQPLQTPAQPPQIPPEAPPAAPVEPVAPVETPLEPVAAPSVPVEPIDAALAKIRGEDLGAPEPVTPATPAGGPETGLAQPVPSPKISEPVLPEPSAQEPVKPATPPGSTKIKKPLKIKPVDNVTAMTRVINKRSTLPILATVQVRNGEMSATDLEVSITKKTDMPDGTYLPVGKNFEPQAQFAMDDHPVIPGPGDPIGTVDKIDFIRNFERAGVASSTDESRYVLNSVLLEVKDGKAKLIATDGRVMSINDLDSGKLKDGQYIIPAVDRTAMALRSLSGDELKVSVNGSTGITFEGSDGRVTVKLIEGHFPKYTEVLPKQYAMASKFSKTAFEDAMKELKPYIKLGEKGRSMIVTMGEDSVTLTVVYGNKETKSIEIQAQHVKSKHPGPGDNPGTIVMPMKTGEEKKNQIGVNPQYLSDTIAGISGEDVFLWTNGGENPMFVRGAAMKQAVKPQEKPKKAKKGYRVGFEVEVREQSQEPIEKGGEKTPGAKQINPAPVATKPGEKLPPRIEPPEMLRLAKMILGEVPTIRKRMKDGVRGLFRPGEGSISLSADIFKDQDAAARTLAHEIGHSVDWLPDRSMAKGNILGSIASLHKYMASLIESMPNQAGKAPDQKELNKMRNAVVVRVVKSHGKTLQEYFKDKSFRASIKEEIKAEVKKTMEKMVSDRKLLTKKEVMDELKAVTQMWKPFDEKSDPKFTAYRYNPRELYADAISVLLNDPAQLKALAPKFYKALFDYMGTKPEFKSAYEALQKEIGGGKIQEVRLADLREMFKRADESGLADMDAMLEEDRGKLEKARYSLIDKNEAMIRRVSKRPTTPEKNPIFKLEAMNYTGSEEKAWMLEVNDIKDYLEKNGVTWEDLGIGTFTERVIYERYDKANPKFHSPKTANEAMVQLEKDLGPDKWKILREGTRRFRENYRVIRELLLESGMLSPELAQKVKDNNYYATFDVVEKDVNGRYGKGVSAGIFKQYGTLKDIGNPATSTVQKGVSLIKAINKNNAARASVEYLSEAFPGEVLEAEFDHYHKSFKQPSNPKQGMIQFMQDGKVKAFYVDKYVAKMFEKDPSDLGFLINILRQTNRLWRGVFIEYNPGFQAFNLIRDFLRAYKNLPKSGVFELMKYYKRSFSKAMSYAYDEQNWVTNKMLREKMLITVENRWGVNTEDEQVSALMRRYLDKVNREDNIFKRFLDHVDRSLREKIGVGINVSRIGRALEALPKVSGYRYLKVNQKELNLTDEQIAHAIRGQVGSPDFLRRGANYSLMNSIFLFSNSIKEGIRSDLEVIRDRPQEFLLKTAKINLAPKILMYAIALGLLGDKWKKYMDSASTFDKMNYIVIPLGETSNGKPIYFRMPQDETGRFFGGMLWWALNKGRKGDLKSAMAYMAGQAPAPTPTIGLAVDTILYSMGFNPYDYFRGKPAINETVFKAGGLRRDRDFLKYMANRMFGGFVQFDTNSLEKNRSTLEKSLNFPVSSNLLGRFVKNSDYGVYEQIKEVADKASTASARERLARRDAMADRINSLETPTISDAKQAYKDMRESGLLKRAGQGLTPGEFIKQWNAMSAQKTGNRYIDAFIFRDTNEERAAMLKFYEQTLEPGEFASIVEQLKKKRLLGPGAWHLYKKGTEE